MNEIISKIHNEGLELKILEYLQKWMLTEIKTLEIKSADNRATMRTIIKILNSDASSKFKKILINDLIESNQEFNSSTVFK